MRALGPAHMDRGQGASGTLIHIALLSSLACYPHSPVILLDLLPTSPCYPYSNVIHIDLLYYLPCYPHILLPTQRCYPHSTLLKKGRLLQELLTRPFLDIFLCHSQSPVINLALLTTRPGTQLVILPTQPCYSHISCYSYCPVFRITLLSTNLVFFFFSLIPDIHIAMIPTQPIIHLAMLAT